MTAALIERKPPHPATALPVASRARGAPKLQDLPVSYRGSIAGFAGTHPKRLKEIAQHTLVMGATGCGKTVAMKLHMWSVLRPVRRVLPDGTREPSRFAMNYRALVYDPKTDLVPFFARMDFSHRCEVILTNPFDARSASWNVAGDVRNSADAQSFADILVQDRSGDEFWQVAAREIVAAAIDGLNIVLPGDAERRHWELRHLVIILESPSLLRQVLARTERGRGVIADYIDVESRLASSVRATLRSNITPYRLVAALWDRAETSFTFKDWSQGAGIILIGDHYKYKESMQRANNLLVRYGIDTLMDRHDEDFESDLTWLYLDELKNAGRFPNFGTMLTQGRSKGIRSVLAAQGLSTMKSIFPEAEVEEVLNNCGDKAIMQLGTAEDAEWAERLFSVHKVTQVSRTVPRDNPSQGSETFSEAREARVHAREFLELASASDTGGGIDAFYHWRGKNGASHNTLVGTSVDQGMPPPILRRRPPEFDARPQTAFTLRPLEAEDYEHLQLVREAPEIDDRAESTATSQRRFKMPPAYD